MSFSHKSGNSEVSGDFSKLEKLIENLEKKHFVDIGILGSAGSTESGKITLAGLGAVHEFGTDRAGRGNTTVIPSRSFIRMPLETGQDDIEKAVQPRLQPLLEMSNINGIFELIGIAGEARIQEAFETGGFGTWEDIKESTKKEKGSDAILIDQGPLRQGITSRVGGQ